MLGFTWLAVLPALASPSHEWIVALAPPSAAHRTGAAPSFADLCARHGVVIRAVLGERLPARRGASLPAPFALDPDRVMLIAAADTTAWTALASSPHVAWIEPNQVREPAHFAIESFPNDPLYLDGRQWGLRNLGAAGGLDGIAGADIDAAGAWAMSVGGDQVRLAFADTGIDPHHPELQAWLPGGGWRIESAIDLVEPWRPLADSFAHGTLVAGVMAARSGDGAHFDSLGVAGVCGGDGGLNPGCRLIPIKVTRGREGTATSWHLAAAILYAARVGARAVNVSFAGAGASRLERLAMHEALVHGCVTVAASGNRGSSNGRLPQYPAAYAADGLGIQVGASDPFDQRAVFSSYGPGLDLLAPGVDVWTTFMTYPSAAGASYPGYVRVSGTSFAAPFVTGTIGLLVAARPELADTDFQQILRRTASDVGPMGVDSLTGWGRLDAARALAAVRSGIGVWHDEVAASAVSRDGWDTLHVREAGASIADRWLGPILAERFELGATFALPDSFGDEVEVWPRIGGTTTMRGDFDLPYVTPWAEVVARQGRRFTLRGYGYRVASSHCPTCAAPEREVPLPLDQMRFGFTVIGLLRRGPLTVVKPQRAPSLAAAPNPFRGATHIAAHGTAALDVYDVGGRRLRTLTVDPTSGTCAWDGCDAAGRPVPPGLYLARPRGRTAPALKLLRLR